MSDPVIDQSTFDSLKEIGGADFINELIDTFLEDAPHMLDELSQALADKNAELFRRTAHSLKSNGNTFGALAFAELAKELEFLGRDNQLEAVGDKFKSLSAEYAKVETALKGMRNA
jgi:HPt (histidine-containing phosphotransfer) domain-containing protein